MLILFFFGYITTTSGICEEIKNTQQDQKPKFNINIKWNRRTLDCKVETKLENLLF